MDSSTLDTAALTTFALERYSPSQFDADAVVSPQQVMTLLEAARRAPSAGNAQPWSFIVGRRGDDVHRRLAPRLSRSSARWALDAGLLLVNLSHRLVEDTDIEYSEFHAYDLGQSVAHLTCQAHAMGLYVHQFRAFDRDAVAAEFDVPRHWYVTSMAAVGRPHPDAAGVVNSGTTTERRPLDELVWASDSASVD